SSRYVAYQISPNGVWRGTSEELKVTSRLQLFEVVGGERVAGLEAEHLGEFGRGLLTLAEFEERYPEVQVSKHMIRFEPQYFPELFESGFILTVEGQFFGQGITRGPVVRLKLERAA